MSQVIAIVGRPNVGKSTLFNRLLGRRMAIVHDMPGVTRDRHIATGEWAGKPFTLIDTGGFVPDSRDEMEMAIREQSELAVRQADVLLFLVDAQTGITRHDELIATELRKSRKPVFVVVNKVDDNGRVGDIYEFHKLALGDPIGISAVQGLNIGDLLDRMTSTFATGQVPEDPRLKIAIVGRPNVGKSSMVNAFLGENRQIVSPVAGTTRDSVDTEFKYFGHDLILIDTAGLRKKSRVRESVEFFSTVRTQRAMERSDVVIVLADAGEGITDQDLRVVSEAIRLGKGIILAVNKWDLIEKTDRTYRELEADILGRLGTNRFVPVMFVSVLEKQRLLKLLDLAIQVQENRRLKISTSKLNDFLLPIIQKTPPPATLGKQIKIKYITQMGTEPPVFGFFTNFPKLIDDAYRRFLERQIRTEYNLSGVPVRMVFKSKNPDADQ